MRNHSPDYPGIGQLARELDRPRRIAITTHFNPDGDAMGSSLGLAHALRAEGHQVDVVLPNRPPPALHWMPCWSDAIAHDTDAERAEEAIAASELLFCVDFNRADRVHALEPALRAASFCVMIDHHLDPEDFARITISDHTACSTCRMAFDVLVGLGLRDRIDALVATCLYTGIMTDTGSFRFSATTPHTHRVAAELLERGAVPHEIHSAIMDQNSLHRMRLLGFTLAERLQVHEALQTATIALSKEDLERHHFVPGDTEGFVNQGLAIRGISLSALFLQRDKVVKVSVRSTGTIPADRIMREHFDGGGHRNAAGGQTREPLDVAVQRFLAVVPDYMPAEVP
jgi:phosphoesterase RecJ-like protein